MPHTKLGQAPLGALFWIAGLSLCVLPFVRSRAALDPEGEDPVRATSETDLPFARDLARWEQEFATSLGNELRAEAEARFGAGSPAQEPGGLLDAARVRAGAAAYATHCAGCHGSSGDGAGPAARYLAPRPRNLRRGIFKFTSTSSGSRPLPADLFGTITRGLGGSSMPDFRLLSEERRWDLVEYVRSVAIRGEFEQLALDLAWEEEEVPDFDEVEDLIHERWDPRALREIYPPLPEVDPDAASIERGRELYFDTSTANCAACHGSTGIGDGPSAGAFLDGWGYPIRPRDLTTGVYRAGSSSADLYLSIASGINGTPMPSFEGSLPPEQIWDLVHFVRSLRK